MFTRQVDVPRYARMVPTDEIANPKNNFNLNLPRYIDSTEPEDLQDTNGHLRGGIPERDVDALVGLICDGLKMLAVGEIDSCSPLESKFDFQSGACAGQRGGGH